MRNQSPQGLKLPLDDVSLNTLTEGAQSPCDKLTQLIEQVEFNNPFVRAHLKSCENCREKYQGVSNNKKPKVR